LIQIKKRTLKEEQRCEPDRSVEARRWITGRFENRCSATGAALVRLSVRKDTKVAPE